MDEKGTLKPEGNLKSTSDASGTHPSQVGNGLSGRLTKLLPPWVIDNLKNKRTWKTVLRCTVSTFAAFVLLLPDKSLRILGNSAFFCVLIALMLPPSMPVQLFFFVISLLIIGMLVGWAFGAASMAAAVRARSVTLLRSQYEIANQSAANAANPDAQFSLEIFQGVFLDWRSSLVYGFMFGAFSFILGVGRAYRPQLALAFNFSQIFLDIFCTFGPLFPNTQYTILSSLFISVACYMAIGVTCCILIFPETMSHEYLTITAKLLGQFKLYTDLFGPILSQTPSQMAIDEKGLIEKCLKLRMGMVMTFKQLQSKSLINLEFSYGRWNGSDAKELEDILGSIVGRLAGISGFSKLVSISEASRSISRTTTKEDGEVSEISTSEVIGDTELIRQLNMRRIASEGQYGLRLEDVLPVLKDSTANLRKACADAILAAQELITETNDTRWFRSGRNVAEKEAALDSAVERLHITAEAFKTDDRMEIVRPFLALFKSADGLGPNPGHLPLRSLIVASTFAAQLLVYADGLLALTTKIQATAHKRQKARLWAPKGLRALARVILKRDRGNSVEEKLGEATAVEIEKEEEEEDKAYRLDPDSRPPANAIQKIMNGIHIAYKWFKSAEALFAIKYLFISVALWLPAVINNSAEFYYVNKGVWALIMAQFCLTVYSSDQIYGIISRSIGTVLGLIGGLLIWYIGNGSGNGNRYGAAAAFGILIIPVVFVRVAAPMNMFQTILMFAATLSLIVGYSWVDGHLTVIGSPGVGWPIAWKRFVLVAIGFGAAVIVMMVPPKSGRKAVRLQHSSAISELSSLYSYLMSVWITDAPPTSDAKTRTEADEALADKEGYHLSVAPTVNAPWADTFRKKTIALAEQLQAMSMATAMAKFEGNIRGAWPADLYNKLLSHERDLLAALGQLSNALQHLDPSWRASLNQRTMILNPNFITDMMSIFALVSQSLRTGEPIHQILPTSLLDRLLYHSSHQKLSEREEMHHLKVAEKMASLDFTYFATGVSAVFQAIQALDEMHSITRKLCGEVPFRGFDQWKQWKDDYDRTHNAYDRQQ